MSKYFCKESEVIYPYLIDRDEYEKKEYLIGTVIKSVYLGQIEKHKGIQTVCEAICKYNSSQNRYQIFLDVYGASLSNLDRELINNYGGFLTIKKGILRDEILNKLSKYDLGFFPSIWEEPFGIAQIELMQAGLPIFSSGMGGSSEPLEKNNHIRFNKGNADDLKLKLANFLPTYNERAMEIGKNAAKHIKNKFSKKNYIYALNNHLDKLVNNYHIEAKDIK